jgi:hypothetical protein
MINRFLNLKIRTAVEKKTPFHGQVDSRAVASKIRNFAPLLRAKLAFVSTSFPILDERFSPFNQLLFYF